MIDLPTGFIIPANRTDSQAETDATYKAGVMTYAAVGPMLDDLPDRALDVDLATKIIGQALARVWQVTGSCVASAAAHAHGASMVGDVVLDSQEVGGKRLPFPWGPYGRGRFLGGMRSKGEGSFGSVHALASTQEEFGNLSYLDPRVPQPTESTDKYGQRWFKWTKRQELDWSYSPEWPIPYEELRKDAAPQGFDTQTQIKNIREAMNAAVHGYGITIAAMFLEEGRIRPTDGLLISDFRGRGGHQQILHGYYTDPTHGRLWGIGNNWGPDVHGEDKIFASLGVSGSYWIREERFEQLLDDPNTEVYAVNGSGDWARDPIKWDDVFVFED